MLLKIMLYEDNDALRNSLEALLQITNEYTIVFANNNCIDIIKDIKTHQPDIILMDIDMPGITGIEAVKKIRQFNKQVFIIMLTIFDDSKNVLDAISNGASGYLLKKHASEKLISAIKDVMEGGAPMSPSIAKMVISNMQKSPSTDYQFTTREKQILQLLCNGNSYKMIASETNLAFETIRSYIKNIYGKLQVHSATEAISKAYSERLI